MKTEMIGFKTEPTVLWNGEQHEVKHPMRKLHWYYNKTNFAMERPCNRDCVIADIYEDRIIGADPVNTHIEVWNDGGEVTIRCCNKNGDCRAMAEHHVSFEFALKLASAYEKGNETK